MRALERSLQLAYPESAVSAKLSGRHVLMLTFDPLPKSVATSSNKAEALRRLAKTALDSFAHGEEVDSVEVSEVRLGMRIRGTGLTAESTIQFPVSELNDGVAKGASK